MNSAEFLMMVSTSEKGACPTPKEVSFDRGTLPLPSLKTSRRSVEPVPSRQSIIRSRLGLMSGRIL